MKHALQGLGVVLALALLSGFSLLSLSVQTARVRWNAYSVGSTLTRGTSLPGTFGGTTDATRTVSFGPAKWRMAGVECAFASAGTTDAGYNTMVVRVVHEDGGEDCACDLGSGSCTTPLTSFSCICISGITQLGGNNWSMQPAMDAGCLTLPGGMFCSSDLFR